MATRTKAPAGKRVTTPTEESFFEPAMPEPYAVVFTIEGIRDYLFNRYDTTPHEELKGQNTDRTPGEMVTLDSDGNLAARALQVWSSVVAAGKYRKNPRSSKGSFSTVLKEALEVEGLDDAHPDLLTFTTSKGQPYKGWDFEDARRIKKAGAFAGHVTRVRPGIHRGWQLTGRATILLPEYVILPQLHEAFAMAGRFGGIGDGRTGGLGFGRFMVRRFEESEIEL